MTNQIATVSAEISTLEAEGKALAKLDKQREAKAKRGFKADIQSDGFIARLGKLMFALKQEGGERISSQRLKDCGINTIDSQRRSEALWFHTNETEARAFIAKSKKGFSSLTALQSAMRKASKPVQEPKATQEPEAETNPNVGANQPEVEEVKAFTQMNAEEIAFEALLQCEINNIPVKEFMLALKDQLQLVDQQAVA
jgi:hypothetical protein